MASEWSERVDFLGGSFFGGGKRGGGLFFLLLFLGFPTKIHSLVLDFPSGKHCFSYILDGFGVIPLGFPREDLH